MDCPGFELEDLSPEDAWMYASMDEFLFNQAFGNYFADGEGSKKRSAEEISQDESEIPDDADPRSTKRARITDVPEDDAKKEDESEDMYEIMERELACLAESMNSWTPEQHKLFHEAAQEAGFTILEDASFSAVTIEETDIQGDTSPEDVSSEETLSREDGFWDHTNFEEAFQDNTEHEDALQDTTSLENVSGENASRANDTQESTSSEDASLGDARRENASQENVTQDSTRPENASPGDASRENTISNTSKEVADPKKTAKEPTKEEIAQLKFEEDVRISQTWTGKGYPPFFNCRFGGDCPYIFTRNVRASELRDHFAEAHPEIYVRRDRSVKCCWNGCSGEGKLFIQHTVLQRHLEPPRMGHQGIHLDVEYDHEEMNKCVEKVRLALERACNPHGASSS